MNTFKSFCIRSWRPALVISSLIIIAYLLYAQRLGSLLPGYSLDELHSYANGNNWHTIINNPVNIPFKLLVWIAVAFGHHSLLIERFIAALFSLFAAILFFYIVRCWHGFRTAFLGTILFATSGGLLHVARLGTPAILQMSILLLIAITLWCRRQKKVNTLFVIYSCVIILSILLYIPGMIWFEVLGLFIVRRDIANIVKFNNRWHKVAWAFIMLLILSPLINAIIHKPKLALLVLHLPTRIHTLTHFINNLIHTILAVGIWSNGNVEFHVGHAPLLDVIEIVLGLIGAYYYFYLKRTKLSVFLGISVLISIVLISMNMNENMTSLIPLLYLFIASGLKYFLERWLIVFPRNPIARTTGIALICIMLFFSVLYQTRSYFIAWPHNHATRQLFSHQL